jgi:V8-like Glu-specific endopeptidase
MRRSLLSTPVAVVTVLAVGGALALTGAVTAGAAMAAATRGAADARGTVSTHGTVSAQGNSGADAGVVHVVGPAAQRAARSFWTASRMAAATGPSGKPAVVPQLGPPPGTPKARHFDGTPTVGALFFTTGKLVHFCTASVVNSARGDLVLTAAHCVYSGSYASHIEFVPGYYDKQQPYGAWPVRAIFVAAGWRRSFNPNLDFAFLAVSPPPGIRRPIQRVTGGLDLGINLGYEHQAEVIGYNDTGQLPVRCATESFEFEARQMEFYCRDYWNGTSGGPWIADYNRYDGSGIVFGDIGGYEQGGDYRWASYSAYFGWATRRLFLEAQRRS